MLVIFSSKTLRLIVCPSMHSNKNTKTKSIFYKLLLENSLSKLCFFRLKNWFLAVFVTMLLRLHG